MRYTTGILIALLLCACNQKTETHTVSGPTGTVQTKTTTVSTGGKVDTTATAEAKQDVKDTARDIKKEVKQQTGKH